MPKRQEYRILIDIMDDGSIVTHMTGTKPLDLKDSHSWSPAQQTAADIYIGLGIPAQTLEDTTPEGSA